MLGGNGRMGVGPEGKASEWGEGTLHATYGLSVQIHMGIT